MKITMIGAGYVGLVTGACFSYMGNKVYCLDIDKRKIDNLKKGEIPIFEQKLDDIISKASNEGNLLFTDNVEKAIDEAEIIFLAVSTPMNNDGSSKLEYILKAASDIGKYIKEYKIIVIKSTVPAGTTALIKKKIEEEIKNRGLKIEFDIANNPEFLKEGKAVDDFMSPDRIIIGLENENLKEIFRDLYRPFSMNHEKLIFLDILSSELTKYAANAMLAMKISFINDISQLCEKIGANINDVRKGIGSDRRIGYEFIYPSIGFGGSCFPKDVSSLEKQFEEVGLTSLMSKATLETNKKQWKNFTSRILSFFSKTDYDRMNIAVWGVTFKPGTDDIRESQAIKIIDKLLNNNINIHIYDPKGMDNAKEYYKNNNKVKFFNNRYKPLLNSDALLLLTEWKEFRSPDMDKIKKLMNRPVIFDGRNIYNNKKMNSLGFKYFQIGVKTSE